MGNLWLWILTLIIEKITKPSTKVPRVGDNQHSKPKKNIENVVIKIKTKINEKEGKAIVENTN